MLLRSIHIFILFFSSFLSKTIFVSAQDEDECDRTCNFNQPEITSETIKLWPVTCSTVCGNLAFTANTDIPQYQLSAYFRKLEYLRGTLRIVNTNFTNIPFFIKVREIDCYSSPFDITGNAKLENLGRIEEWTYNTRLCTMNVFDNPKLDVTPICDKPNILMNIYGNLKDCPCKNLLISPQSISSFTNCTKIENGDPNGLRITQVTDGSSLRNMASIKTIEGNLEVWNTELEDISFLSALESLNGSQYQEGQMMRIHNNPKLKRLGLDSFKQVLLYPGASRYSVNISNVHADFCFATTEVEALATGLSYFVSMRNFKYCKDLTRRDGQKVCHFERMSSLEEGCVHLIGDVIVDQGDEEHVEKLRTVTNIHGSITIQNTNLIDVGFLSHLRYVSNIVEDEPPKVKLLKNLQLQNATIPNLKHLFPYSEKNFVLNGNAPGLLKNGKECMIIERRSECSVSYNGGSCGRLTTEYQANNTKSTAVTTDGSSAKATTVLPSKDTDGATVSPSKGSPAHLLQLSIFFTICYCHLITTS